MDVPPLSPPLHSHPIQLNSWNVNKWTPWPFTGHLHCPNCCCWRPPFLFLFSSVSVLYLCVCRSNKFNIWSLYCYLFQCVPTCAGYSTPLPSLRLLVDLYRWLIDWLTDWLAGWLTTTFCLLPRSLIIVLPFECYYPHSLSLWIYINDINNHPVQYWIATPPPPPPPNWINP